MVKRLNRRHPNRVDFAKFEYEGRFYRLSLIDAYITVNAFKAKHLAHLPEISMDKAIELGGWGKAGINVFLRDLPDAADEHIKTAKEVLKDPANEDYFALDGDA